MHRSFKWMLADAHLLLHEIRAADREPSEFFFDVTRIEHCLLMDQPPFFQREMPPERHTICGIPIRVVRR